MKIEKALEINSVIRKHKWLADKIEALEEGSCDCSGVPIYVEKDLIPLVLDCMRRILIEVDKEIENL